MVEDILCAEEEAEIIKRCDAIKARIDSGEDRTDTGERGYGAEWFIDK